MERASLMRRHKGISMRKLVPDCLIFLLAMFIPVTSLAQSEEAGKHWIAHFDRGEAVGLASVSSPNLMDESQWIKLTWVDDDALGKPGGKSIRLDYDVDSYEPAKAFFWLTLREEDLSHYDTFHLYLKGSEGSRGHVTVQLVDSANRPSPYVVGRIEDRWKEFRIPLKRFARIHDWSRVRELSIVIDDTYAIPKEGALFIDEIFLSAQAKKVGAKK